MNIQSPALRFAFLFGLQFSITHGAVNFVFNFTDVNVGFNAPGQVGADRRAGLQEAGNRIAALFSNYTADIQIDVNGSVTDDTTLASASSNFNFVPSSDGFGGRGDVGLKILGGNGADPNSSVADGVIDWNFQDFSWETQSDFQPGEMDLVSTAMHELLHSIGFSSDITQIGEDSYGTAPGNPGIWTPFDQWVGNSNAALIGVDFSLNGVGWNAASVGGAGTIPAAAGLYFHGPNALAANGGNPVALYSPTIWDDGSSGSHLDTDFFTGAQARMMNHESPVSEGLDIRDVDPLTLAMFRDIGFTQITIPEPSSTTLLTGLIAMMVICRRRA